MEYTRIGIILLACLCARIQGNVPEPEVLAKSLPGYAVTTAIELLNSTECRRQMEEFRDAVGRGVFWSLRMLDASGQPSSGFTTGNNYWIGNRVQCEYLSQRRMLPVKEEKMKTMPIYQDSDDNFPPFELNFFGAQMRHNSTMQYHLSIPAEEVLMLGICLPASCTEHEVTTMLRKVFDEKLLLVTNLFPMDFEFLKISNLKDDHMWMFSGKMILIFLILAALLGAVIAGTIYDVRVHQKYLENKTKLLVKTNNNVEMKGDTKEKQEQEQEHTAVSEVKSDTRTRQILLCFSAYSNVKQIFDLNTTSEDIPSLHGFRFLGMMWIILFHMYYYTINAIANRGEGYLMTNQINLRVISNASLSVDIFFFLSGFLLAHGHFKKQKTTKTVASFRNNVTNFVDAIIKRYVRIMPTYFVTMLLVMVMFTWYEQFSIQYFSEPMHHVCSKYWWRNMLFISNLFEWDEICLNWSWYLSDDMQFYIFGTFLLILSTKYYYTAITLGVVTLIASTAVHAYIAYAMGYKPTYDMYYETLSDLYIKPHTRIPSFLVGMGTVLLLAKWDYKLQLSKRALTTCWSLATLCLLTISFGFTHTQMPLSFLALDKSCHRFVWSLGIAWIVIACITGNGGIVNTVLSFPCWIPLSRLSYCAYLLNPVVIISFAMLSEHPIYFEVNSMLIVGVGTSAVVYGFSIIASVVAEIPITLCYQKFSSFDRKIK